MKFICILHASLNCACLPGRRYRFTLLVYQFLGVVVVAGDK